MGMFAFSQCQGGPAPKTKHPSGKTRAERWKVLKNCRVYGLVCNFDYGWITTGQVALEWWN
jgi:hypothetical protein